MERETEVVKVALPNGVAVGVEVVASRGASNVGALDHLDFSRVQAVVEGLAQVVVESLQRVQPQKATAELGLSLKVESGQLTGVLVKAGGDASIKISLTWEHSAPVVALTAAAKPGEHVGAGAE
jgi:hypothetical protein